MLILSGATELLHSTCDASVRHRDTDKMLYWRTPLLCESISHQTDNHLLDSIPCMMVITQMTELELNTFFSQFGVVKDSKIITDRNGVSKG